MPATRSASRTVGPGAAVTSTVTDTPTQNEKPSKTKRKASDAPNGGRKKSRTAVVSSASLQTTTPSLIPNGDMSSSVEDEPHLVPAVLSFSFEDAKNHLISVDRRFEDLFAKMKCKPFEFLEQVHPFRALATSILGQQISWMAARSITHKFIRLFDPSIPEKYSDYPESKSPTSSFPTPRQVASMDIATLRTAGLSGRKAEYVQDLAARFADGRLSTEKLIEADDEELARMLIEVRGIGRWTGKFDLDMFAIFSLRRPDILPVGDLGVQRGALRWFLSLHSPSHSFSLSPEKVGGNEPKGDTPAEDKDVLPVFGTQQQPQPETTTTQSLLDVSSVPPAPVAATPLKKNANEGSSFSVGLASMPTPFTPSINKTLNEAWKEERAPGPLPEGLSVAILKSRLDGKKKIKGALLTPKEMEDLTESWKPYRSLGVYYMWSLAPEEK